MTTVITSLDEALTEKALKARISEFVSAASIEVTPHDEDRLPQIMAYLAPGTGVYIAHPPRRLLQDVVRVAAKVQKLGYQACPHVLARELQSEKQLRAALTDLNAAGIEQMLLVAGDQNSAAGPFPGTVEVLETGATVDCGMKTVAVAGHPEGHKVIGPSLLWDALRAKQAFAQRTGTHVHVVTQFGFNPQAVFDWQQHCRDLGIALPAHVGLAGPTPLPKLIHFAMQCGIGASLRTLMKSASALTHLARVTSTPEEMLVGLVRRRGAAEPETQTQESALQKTTTPDATPDFATPGIATPGIATPGIATPGTTTPGTTILKPHFYCFGGSLETARWLQSVIDGSFDLSVDGSRFTVRA